MATAVEILDADLSHWVPGTRFFSTDDDRWFVVDADMTEYPANSRVKFVRRPTAVLYCNPDATVTDLVPDYLFPAGTSPEEAVALMGLTLEA